LHGVDIVNQAGNDVSTALFGKNNRAGADELLKEPHSEPGENPKCSEVAEVTLAVAADNAREGEESNSENRER
jgi:hypothetical protein